MVTNKNVDLSGIPPNWFLYYLIDERTGTTYKGDTHTHIHWKCALQHILGGRLMVSNGSTAQEAIDAAVNAVVQVP